MRYFNCAYCTSEAIALDEDGHPTCGSRFCEPSAAPLPAFRESSDDSDDDEDGIEDDDD